MSNKRVTPKQRRQVIARARGYCEYCCSQVAYSTQSFSIEHIMPRSKQGKTTLDNLALSCQGCNNHKHTKTKAPDPSTTKLARLYHPREQRWSEHFAWSDDCMLIVGITPTGRATIEALQLNREGVVNLRRLLYPVGEHPPKEGPSEGSN